MKYFYQTLLTLCISLLGGLQLVHAQGCVAVRPCSPTGYIDATSVQQNGQWQVAATHRYFRSFRHFRGSHQEKERVEAGTQVINTTHSIDLSISHAFNSRFGLALNLPVIFNDRSSLYEHYGNSLQANPNQLRFHTGSRGIGDLRLTSFYWLLNPERRELKGNISLGLGIKAPTGNANVQGDFHRFSEESGDYIFRRAVDQSIQLGDGGWGGSLEVQGYHNLGHRSSLYFNGFYLFNPRNHNNTLSRGTLEGVDPLIAYHSVADQYAGRLGLNYQLFPKAGITTGLGVRLEGIPAHDLIGKSEGFRRPGYIASVEPGLLYIYKDLNFVLTAPIALYRNRIKSVYDLADPAGERHGDAAFADYLLNFTVVYSFRKKSHQPMKNIFQQVEDGADIH